MNNTPENATVMFAEEPIDSSTGVNKIFNNIKSGIKKLTSPSKFEAKDIPNAHDCYLMSRYGKIGNDTERLERFIQSIADTLKYKNLNGEYAMVQSVPEDIIEHIDSIIEFFTKRGYTVKEMSTLIPELSSKYLFIAFDDFALIRKNLEKNEKNSQQI